MRSLCSRSVVLPASLLASLVAPTSAQDVRLNGTLPSPRGGDLREHQLLSDGRQLLYLADQEKDERFELFLVSAAAGGFDRRTLNGALVEGGAVEWFLLTPDESHVVYAADQDTNDLRELYSAPLAGGPAVKLHEAGSAGLGRLANARISADSSQVVFVAGLPRAQELRVAPVDGSTPSVRLSEPAHGNVLKFALSPDASRAIYSAGNSPQGVYSVPLDGSRAALSIVSPRYDSLRISDLAVTADSSRVILRMNHRLAGRIDLYTVGVDGGPLTEYVRPNLSNDVTKFVLAGDRIVLENGPRLGNMEVLSLPLDGSLPAVQLNPPQTSVSAFTVSPDGTRVATVAASSPGGAQLYVAPIDGSTAPVQVNPPLVATGAVSSQVQFSPDSTRLVYQATQDSATQLELYGAPADASALPVKLNPVPVPEGTLSAGFAFAGNDGVVFKGDLVTPGTLELFSAPLAGGPAVQLSGPMGRGGDVTIDTFQVPDASYRVSANGRVVSYVADQEEDSVLELYAGPVRGTAPFRKINLDMPIGPVEGDVSTHRLTADGQHVVYLADQLENDTVELFISDTDHSPAPRRLNAPLVSGGSVHSFALSPDGTRVAYLADAEVAGRIELYSVELDGSLPPRRLNGPMASNGRVMDPIRFTPDSTKVLFVQQSSTTFQIELQVAAADASGAPVLLSPATVAGGGLSYDSPDRTFLITPDGARVVFCGDLAVLHQSEVWSAPIDGSAAPIRLSGPLQPDGDTRLLQLVSSGDRVLYRGDAQLDGVVELFSAPIDGSAAAVELDGSLVHRGDPVVDESGQRAVFIASDSDERLFVVPVDGSALPSTLTPVVPRGTTLATDLQVAQGRVFVRAMIPGRLNLQLYSVPLDGSGAPRRLSWNLPDDSTVTSKFSPYEPSFEVTPDGRSVAFLAFDGSGFDLYAAPADGRAAARRLATSSYADPIGGDFLFTPDSRAVLFRQKADPARQAEVYLTSLEGGPVRRIGAATTKKVNGFTLSPDGRRLVALAEQFPGVSELFLSFLPPSHLAPR